MFYLESILKTAKFSNKTSLAFTAPVQWTRKVHKSVELVGFPLVRLRQRTEGLPFANFMD